VRLILESTAQLVHVNGVPARVWTGVTEGGIRVDCFITRILVSLESDQSAFEAELSRTAPMMPDALNIYPLRMIL
jgi:hypothetical protein